MDNKYYTPTLDEFYIGFEFEYLFKNQWVKSKLENPIDRDELLFNINYLLPKENKPIDLKYIRVKYLDKEDIESLGYTQTDPNIEHYKNKYDFYIKTNSNDGSFYGICVNKKEPMYIMIYGGSVGAAYPNTDIWRFKGIIKNKSELVKILKQLKLITNEK